MNATGLDNQQPISGYYDSPWPTECGGPRRQKAPRSKGLAMQPGETLKQRTRMNGEWNVMTVQRAPGETYLLYNNHIASSEKYGGVAKIDPESLETLKATPRLPSGGHNWCGGIVVHENGYVYMNNGDRCFKIDPDCNVVAEKKLPQDACL